MSLENARQLIRKHSTAAIFDKLLKRRFMRPPVWLFAGLVSKPSRQVAQTTALRRRRRVQPLFSAVPAVLLPRSRPRPRRTDCHRMRPVIPATDSLRRRCRLLAGDRRILCAVSGTAGAAVFRSSRHVDRAIWRLHVVRGRCCGPRQRSRKIKVSQNQNQNLRLFVSMSERN